MTGGRRKLPGMPQSHANHTAWWKDVAAPAESQQAPGKATDGNSANIAR